MIIGDASQLARLARNLLTNAARHATTSVRVTVRSTPGTAELVVEDDGTGIPPDVNPRIFQRFVRLDDARTTTSGGNGLGLAIAHDITKLHSGSITIDDSELGGARFTVRFPHQSS